MLKSPLITIAMATYNGDKYLKKQLDSIYAQTYKNIEVIVTDDCSTDSTIDILKEYKEKYGLQYFVNEQNLGFVKNFERAISLCEGEYIALADQDDIWEKNKLEELLGEIGSNLLIHSDCSIIDEQDKIISLSWKGKLGYRHSLKHLLFANAVTGCTILFNKELLKMALPFPEGIVYHDWWLAVCAANVEKLKYTPKCLIQYRQHNAQNTGSGIDKKTTVAKTAYSNIKNRWNNNNTQRVVTFRVQKKNLLAIKNNIQFNDEKKVVLNDALAYIEDYLNYKLHLKTFYIGMKYHKVLYPYKNYMFMQNILMDIIG